MVGHPAFANAARSTRASGIKVRKRWTNCAPAECPARYMVVIGLDLDTSQECSSSYC